MWRGIIGGVGHNFSASLARMLEVTGDASRDGEWACVRLVVDDDRIVEADAEGLERSLVGLTLLEAAAVPGERLAADALANAIGPIFRAPPDSGRVAVAMSGGVDSAVALLRAGSDAIGVTLRLWIDPKAPHSERACCSPEAVVAARETCHARGLPHVTLDAREAFRLAIVKPFVDGYARGETPNPCTRCNGSFRFAQLLAFARRAGAARLATGHYARIVEHRGRLLLARAVDDHKDQSYMLARVDPRVLDRIWFPLGDQTKEMTRAEAERRVFRRRGVRRARRPVSWAAATTASFSSATGSQAGRDRSSTRTATRLASTPASGASRRDSGAASASPSGGPRSHSAQTRRRIPSSSAHAGLSHGDQ